MKTYRNLCINIVEGKIKNMYIKKNIYIKTHYKKIRQLVQYKHYIVLSQRIKRTQKTASNKME